MRHQAPEINAPEIRVAGSYNIAGQTLFENLELILPPAQWTCLLGPSGVGKSTLLRLILGLPMEGEFTGTIAASDTAPLPGRVSYMAQSDLLLPWLDVRGNTVLGARLRGEPPDMARAKDLLKRVGLQDHLTKKPAELSGGMRQRVALARTLMEDCPVVLLDEPFSALDAGTRADMQELAAEVLKGRTVFLVTHDPSEAARMAHQIVLMAQDHSRLWNVPKTTPPRAIDDPQAFKCQTALMALLRQDKNG